MPAPSASRAPSRVSWNFAGSARPCRKIQHALFETATLPAIVAIHITSR
jgi:hypothetical protein